jgi:hypothetical protein
MINTSMTTVTPLSDLTHVVREFPKEACAPSIINVATWEALRDVIFDYQLVYFETLMYGIVRPHYKDKVSVSFKADEKERLQKVVVHCANIGGGYSSKEEEDLPWIENTFKDVTCHIMHTVKKTHIVTRVWRDVIGTGFTIQNTIPGCAEYWWWLLASGVIPPWDERQFEACECAIAFYMNNNKNGSYQVQGHEVVINATDDIEIEMDGGNWREPGWWKRMLIFCVIGWVKEKKRPCKKENAKRVPFCS